MRINESTYPLKVIKLINGDTIIARVDYTEKESNEHFTVSEAMRIVSFDSDYPPEDYGASTIALIRWNPFTDDEYITINVNRVITISNVSSTFLKYYESAINKVQTEDHILDTDNITDETYPDDADDATKALKELTNAFSEMMKKTKRTLH
jgi:hypothetical protein